MHHLAGHQHGHGLAAALQLRHQSLLALGLGGALVIQHPPACQGVIGLHGAAMIADSLRPDVCLVTDVGHATDSPGILSAQHGLFRLGGGPKLAVGAQMHPEVVQRLEAAAESQSIPIQRAAVPGSSGTDTDAIFLASGGIPCGLLSLPIRYMHTTVEMGSLRDLKQISEVFAGFAAGLGSHTTFVPRL